MTASSGQASFVVVPDRRPTSHDVAAAAGVSQSTVSLVLSGKADGRVSARVQDRVRAAADALGYRPDAAARTLRSGRAGAVGLLVPDVTNPFLGRVLRGAQARAREADVQVALVEPGDDRDDQLQAMQALRAGSVDGLLLFVVAPPPPDELARRGPVVVLDAVAPGVPSVTVDVAGGFDAAIAHLVALGHRRIAHLGADVDASTFRVRRARWLAAMDELGMPAAGRSEAWAPFDLDAAREAGHRLLASSPRPTAVVCDDDLLAAGLRVAADEADVDVPGALSIVGFADTVLSQVTTPALTTVAAPAEELGATALGHLLALIAGTPAPMRTELPVRLVARASTAPPAAPEPSTA
ncbi:MAG: LacI family DNA-binding transcriptional regulator [Actinomycetota bacterium]|nr:LacI family DNA-binding transcriptional regulator [Actinomycetota bacterium]